MSTHLPVYWTGQKAQAQGSCGECQCRAHGWSIVTTHSCIAHLSAATVNHIMCACSQLPNTERSCHQSQSWRRFTRLGTDSRGKNACAISSRDSLASHMHFCCCCPRPSWKRPKRKWVDSIHTHKHCTSPISTANMSVCSCPISRGKCGNLKRKRERNTINSSRQPR